MDIKIVSDRCLMQNWQEVFKLVTMDAPNIEIDQADIERMTSNSGPTVADIIVNHEDGRTTRFFITVSLNKQGRAVCEVSSNGPEEATKSIRKSVCGYKHGEPS